MKTINLLIYSIIIFFCSTSIAKDKSNSSLNLSLFNGDNFTAVFNDVNINEPTNELNLNNLQSGKYYLKIVHESKQGNNIQDIIFSDYIDIPSNCKIYVVIDESGRLYVYKKINDYENYYQNHKQLCDCDCEFCKKCIYKDKHFENRKKEDELNDHSKEEEINSDCEKNSLKDKDFEYAIKTINEKPFEETKLAIAKQILDQNILTSLQVRDLLKTFTFDDSKVNIAEYAYDKTCDKKNYFKIYDVFLYGSNVQMVKDYISGK